MQTIRKKIQYQLPYTLEEAHMVHMDLVGNRLRVLFEDGFYKGEEKLEGKVFFEDVDLEASELTIYKIDGDKIKGKRHDLVKFIKKHDAFDLEIIEETYNDYLSLYKGIVHKGDKVKEFVLSIVHTGNMIYDTEGESVAVNQPIAHKVEPQEEVIIQQETTFVTPTSADRYLIKNTTREERLKIVKESLGVDVDCEGFDGGLADMYDDYIEGLKELSQINAEFRGHYFKKDEAIKR